MNETLPSEEPSSLEGTNTYLSKEKVEKDSNERIAEKSSEKVENGTARKTFKEKRLDSKESSSLSGSKEYVKVNLGFREATKKSSGSRELSKEISDSTEYIKENYGIQEKRIDGIKNHDKCEQNIVPTSLFQERHAAEKVFEKTTKRKSRPYFYDRIRDAIPKSLKEEKLVESVRKRTPRPFCYDESLDGVTKSLLNSIELGDDETKAVMTRSFKYPFVQPSSHTQEMSKDNRTKETEDFAENQAEESEADVVQEMEKMTDKFNLLKGDSSVFDPRDRSTANDVLSAQKLVKGENVMDFTCSYIFSKKSLEEVMKLEHKFLWRQQRHISDFRRSEAVVP
ncbi:unnamed protein product [Onchocerca flexuosa]|uniref:TPX2 domain-containing protein n=1 Tax=Onchocerca flexuosa TaxID=387005 RepID=A0A183H3T1_9BILA|nr:unnamed protein product [Onchocerca flexuosa]